MHELKLKIRIQDFSLIQELYGTDEPLPLQRIQISDNTELIHQQISIRHGLIETSIIIGLVLSISGDVAAELITNWLMKKLEGKNAKLDIGSSKIQIANFNEIEAALTKEIRKKNART